MERLKRMPQRFFGIVRAQRMDWIMSLMQQAGLELGAVEGWGFDLPWHKILSAGAGTCVYCLGAFRSHA